MYTVLNDGFLFLVETESQERVGPGPAFLTGRLDPDRGPGHGVRMIVLCLHACVNECGATAQFFVRMCV